MACRYTLEAAAGQELELQAEARSRGRGDARLISARGYERTFAARIRKPTNTTAALRPPGASDEEVAVMRQAFAGMIWSQQFYHFDVKRWLDGDPAQPAPPAARRSGRNVEWKHLDSHDIIAMPDKWEYPWFAGWDCAFHCIVLAYVDPAAAKHQLLMFFREWYMHPEGMLPAYEWNFSDVNPPIHAWAALTIFEIDGRADFNFLARAFHKLLINFTWWVNRNDAAGDNIFEGGFLGLDNIGPFDRSKLLPGGEILEQSDATAWMAKYCLNMLEIALVLANHDSAYEDIALKFFEHFGVDRLGDGRALGRGGWLFLRPVEETGWDDDRRPRALHGRTPADLRLRPVRCVAVGCAAHFSRAGPLVPGQRSSGQRLHETIHTK